MKTNSVALSGVPGAGPHPVVLFEEMQALGGSDQSNEHVVALQASRPRPWIRYWARTVDLVLAGAAFSVAAASLGADVTHWNNFVFGWLVVMLWVPFEAAFVSSCGTTPGKWLFNIRLSKADGSYLTFQQSLGRAIGVLIKGEGFGIPVVSFFTQLAARGALKSQGITPWDKQHDVAGRHERIGAGRVLGIVLTWLVLVILASRGSSASDPNTDPAGLSAESTVSRL